jgi:seryl-tRNA synthetase
VLDLKLIRDNPEGFDKALKKRGLEPLSETILTLDAERRGAVTALQDAQARRNQLSKEVGKAKGAKDEALAQKLMAEVGALKDTIASGEAREKEISAKLDEILTGTPNLPADDVPVGDESANKELRKSGKPPKFNFEPKQHFELGEAFGLMDFETAAKLSGSRFVVLKGVLARMERALANFMLDMHTGEFGYQEVNPPLLVRDDAMRGTGQLPKFKNDLFASTSFLDGTLVKDGVFDILRATHLNFCTTESFSAVADENGVLEYSLKGETNPPIADVFKELKMEMIARLHWLVPTAEVPLTNIVREKILNESDLPFRFTAHTPCFRAEAGAAGKDTRGMIRLHQFSKVELVSITTPEQSEAEHERMTSCAEEVLKRLGLAYRTVVLASGDMGFSARKTYDIEVWLPGQNAYREISSCSNCGGFQARRMNARYRPKEGKELRFVHTLNGSALAVGRTLVAILENYQQKDGSIRIPEVLVPYMGGLEVIEAPAG